ncbi:thiamine kinase [Vibrio maritimus]|uniref:Thiamine kinase n=1 Tax=Vibrio maritimus TaxID=990268 RepID=A0A090TDU1_9VIBR|nr:thiamine kinase [Vibrio maritimus]
MQPWKQALQSAPNLAAIPSLINEVPLGALPLSGGLTNRCWRVLTPSYGWLVWRVDSEHCHVFDIDRRNETNVLLSVEGHISANRVVAQGEQGLLVTWCEGKPVSTEHPADVLVGELAKVHDINPSLSIRHFDLAAKLEHYWAHIHDSVLKRRYKSLYEKYRFPPKLKCKDNVLCHFDFGRHNLLSAKDKLVVIDWEYAAMASPTLDLVMTLDMLGLDYETGLNLYQQHRYIDSVHEWLHDMHSWRPHTEIMAMLWYVLAAEQWKNPEFLVAAEQIYQRNC